MSSIDFDRLKRLCEHMERLRVQGADLVRSAIEEIENLREDRDNLREETADLNRRLGYFYDESDDD